MAGKTRKTWIIGALVLVALVLLASVLVDQGSVGTRRGTSGLGLGFPRTGIIWPDTAKQPLEDIARYDYIVLGDWQYEYASRIKTENPERIVLASTGACEPAFDEIRGIPSEWLLTEAGTRLTAPVDAVSRRLPVATTKGLFRLGDAVMIDHEVGKVTAVEPAALVVERGRYKSAARHTAGSRVAACLSFWPGQAIADVTTDCPRVTVNRRYGPETWGEYNARHGASEVLADPALDGTFIDRSDGYESWLVRLGVVSSIDPSRTNSPPTDGYRAFDAAWNAGLRAYETEMRSLVGDKILLGNGAYPNLDLLNGTVFETFPSADGGWWSEPWQGTMFGPRRGRAYLDWSANAVQPNLTTVLTYEDDSSPGPADDTDYRGRAIGAGFVPDYRKMRYGLTTALMGDGFFVYEVGTFGHASLGLMWFDEYDNGGKGTGYLRMPLGPARHVPGTDAVYRRDYEGGVALVNASDKAERIDLGETFVRIKGTQVPSLNDGSPVRILLLPARDGTIVLRGNAP